MSGMIRTTITLPQASHERATILSLRHSCSLNEVLMDAVDLLFDDLERKVRKGEMSAYEAGLPEVGRLNRQDAGHS